MTIRQIMHQRPLRDEYIRLGLVPVQMDGKSLSDVPDFAYVPNLGEFAERLATLPLLADPGTYWRYSMSPDLLGVRFGSGCRAATAETSDPTTPSTSWECAVGVGVSHTLETPNLRQGMIRASIRDKL